ncbi:MAG: hypothetical protein R2722_07515 [Tessaracoccus sp.]
MDGSEALPLPWNVQPDRVLRGRPPLRRSFIQALRPRPTSTCTITTMRARTSRWTASRRRRAASSSMSNRGGSTAKPRAGEGAYERWNATRREREETYMASNREAAGDFERDQEDLETGGYDQVALAIMHAIANDRPAQLILNVANRGSLPELDDDAVVEMPCRVDGRGVTRLPGVSLPEHGRGLVVNAKAVERYTIRAAIAGSRADALLALTHHPLVGSFRVAEELLDDLIGAFPELAALR